MRNEGLALFEDGLGDSPREAVQFALVDDDGVIPGLPCSPFGFLCRPDGVSGGHDRRIPLDAGTLALGQLFGGVLAAVLRLAVGEVGFGEGCQGVFPALGGG